MLCNELLTTRDFRRFQALVQSEAGIFLSEQKRCALAGRLAPRLRALALPTFAAYYDRVWSDREELVRMIDALCTHETHFFRDPQQFAFLERHVLPAWRAAAGRARRVRVWSAGCATGEEPFSIAMSLAWHLPGWPVEIVASAASANVWPMQRAEEIPPHYRKTFLLRGREEGTMTARPELAAMIRFAHIDLHDEASLPDGRFDVIFCRNVLTDFDAALKRRAIDGLLERLDPAGYLFLGQSESLDDDDRVRLAGPAVYVLGGEDAARPAGETPALLAHS